jgi:D-lactate dehydrogenase (cytochrome)
MAKSTFVLPRVVLSRTLASRPQPRTHDILRLAQSQCRRFHGSPPRQEEKLSFRGQLYESTAQRLARERAEEARFAATRDAAGNSTLRLFATTFGMWDIEFGWPFCRSR